MRAARAVVRNRVGWPDVPADDAGVQHFNGTDGIFDGSDDIRDAYVFLSQVVAEHKRNFSFAARLDQSVFRNGVAMQELAVSKQVPEVWLEISELLLSGSGCHADLESDVCSAARYAPLGVCVLDMRREYCPSRCHHEPVGRGLCSQTRPRDGSLRPLQAFATFRCSSGPGR